MACVEIPDSDLILAPWGAALGLEGFSEISEPNLFSDSFWNGLALYFKFRIDSFRPRHIVYTLVGIRPKDMLVNCF